MRMPPCTLEPRSKLILHLSFKAKKPDWDCSIQFFGFGWVARTGNSKPIHVQERVTHAQKLIRALIELLLIAMRKQLWKIVFGTLLADAICRRYQNIRQETWLRWRNVCKPTTHFGGIRKVSWSV